MKRTHIWLDTLNPMYHLLIPTLVQRYKGQVPSYMTWGNPTLISNFYTPKGLCLWGLHSRPVNPLSTMLQKRSILSLHGTLDLSATITLSNHKLSTSTHYHAQMSDLTPISYPILERTLFKSLCTYLIIFCRLMLVTFSLCFSITPPINIY